jgi:hypothetical protein
MVMGMDLPGRLAGTYVLRGPMSRAGKTVLVLALLAVGMPAASSTTADHPDRDQVDPFSPSKGAPPRRGRKQRPTDRKRSGKTRPQGDRVPDDDPDRGAPWDRSGSPPEPPDESETNLA